MCAMTRRVSASNPAISGAAVNYRVAVSSAVHERWFVLSSGYSHLDWHHSSNESNYASGVNISSGARVSSGGALIEMSGGYAVSGKITCNIPISAPYWSGFTLHGGALLDGLGGGTLSVVSSILCTQNGCSSTTATGRSSGSAYVSSRYNDSRTEYRSGHKEPFSAGWAAQISGGSVGDPRHFFSGGTETRSGSATVPYFYAAGNVTIFPGREGDDSSLMLYECGNISAVPGAYSFNGFMEAPSAIISGLPLSYSYLGGQSGFHDSIYVSDYSWSEGNEPVSSDYHVDPTQSDWTSQTAYNPFFTWSAPPAPPPAAWGSHTDAGPGGTVITFGGYSAPSPLAGASAAGGGTSKYYTGKVVYGSNFTSGGSTSSNGTTSVSFWNSAFATAREFYNGFGTLMSATISITLYPASGGSVYIISSSSPVSGAMVLGAETWYASARGYLSGAYASAISDAAAVAGHVESYTYSRGNYVVSRSYCYAYCNMTDSETITNNILSGGFV